MAICFHESSKEFHLYNKDISYILTVLENGRSGTFILERNCGTGRVLRI